jgi:hypothetical protein
MGASAEDMVYDRNDGIGEARGRSGEMREGTEDDPWRKTPDKEGKKGADGLAFG